MPLPKSKEDEKTPDFIARCMRNETMKEEYPNRQQRLVICFRQAKKKKVDWTEMNSLKKEGRVLSAKNKAIIQQARDVLDKLLNNQNI